LRLKIFRFYLLEEEEEKTVQLKVKDVMMNTAKEDSERGSHNKQGYEQQHRNNFSSR
jgi:hypothetical protein